MTQIFARIPRGSGKYSEDNQHPLTVNDVLAIAFSRVSYEKDEEVKRHLDNCQGCKEWVETMRKIYETPALILSLNDKINKITALSQLRRLSLEKS